MITSWTSTLRVTVDAKHGIYATRTASTSQKLSADGGAQHMVTGAQQRVAPRKVTLRGWGRVSGAVSVVKA